MTALDRLRNAPACAEHRIETDPNQSAPNVHTAHCCLVHGCKYSDDSCPVASHDQKQEYPCERCSYSPQPVPAIVYAADEGCPACTLACVNAVRDAIVPEEPTEEMVNEIREGIENGKPRDTARAILQALRGDV